MRISALFAFFCFTLHCLAEVEARIFPGKEVQLPYRLIKPEPFDPAVKYPLIVFLHGAGERGTDNIHQADHILPLLNKPENRRDFPCFVFAPQCPNEKKWVEMPWTGESGTAPQETSPLQKAVLEAMSALSKEFPIDANRMYITGLSMGGYGTWDFITRFPEKWAAAAPVCGGGDKSRAGRAKSVPTWAFHGSDDAVVLPVRTHDMVGKLRTAGGKVVETVYPKVGHDSWVAAYSERNFLPWLFAQRRGQAANMTQAVSRNIFAMLPDQYFAGSGPIRRGEWFENLWIERRSNFSAWAPSEQGAVVFLGDSITQGWETLVKDFPRFKTANRGIAGDTSRGVLFRLPDDVLNLKPKAVSLLIGTNDLGENASAQVVAGNIREIIKLLRRDNPKLPIILNYVMPRELEPGKFPDRIKELNGLIDEIARGDSTLVVCDTWTIFDDGASTTKPEEFPDKLHPNPAGYAKWKTSLDAVFQKIGL